MHRGMSDRRSMIDVILDLAHTGRGRYGWVFANFEPAEYLKSILNDGVLLGGPLDVGPGPESVGRTSPGGRFRVFQRGIRTHIIPDSLLSY